MRAYTNPFHREQAAAWWCYVGKNFQFSRRRSCFSLDNILVFRSYFQHAVMVSGLYFEVCCDIMLSHL